jgi:hypothetical protein
MLKIPEKSNLAFTRRQSLVAALAGAATIGLGLRAAAAAEESLPIEGAMPPLASDGLWLNSAPLTREALRGKVVLVRFLDLFLHQLPAHAALCAGLARQISRARVGGDRRPYARVRV